MQTRDERAMTRSLNHLFDQSVAGAQTKIGGDPSFRSRIAEQPTRNCLRPDCSARCFTAKDFIGLDSSKLLLYRNIANIVNSIDPKTLKVPESAVGRSGRAPFVMTGTMRDPVAR